MRYRVIKEIEGWEDTAKVGDILTVERWAGYMTLMKGDKAVCDQDSPAELECCEIIEEDINNE